MTTLGINTISDLRLGGSQVQAAYLGNVKVWSKEQPYIRIDYIECTTTQFIDTGIKATGGVKYEQTVAALSNLSIGIGSHSKNQFNGYNRFEAVRSTSFNRMEVNKCEDMTLYLSYSGDLSQKHTWTFDAVLNKKVFSVDDTVLINTTDSYILNPDTNLTIFKRLYDDTINPFRFYGGKIWDSSYSLVRDFIPVKIENTGYLYDNVSGQLFGNAGTGDFVLGPIVTQ